MARWRHLRGRRVRRGHPRPRRRDDEAAQAERSTRRRALQQELVLAARAVAAVGDAPAERDEALQARVAGRAARVSVHVHGHNTHPRQAVCRREAAAARRGPQMADFVSYQPTAPRRGQSTPQGPPSPAVRLVARAVGRRGAGASVARVHAAGAITHFTQRAFFARYAEMKQVWLPVEYLLRGVDAAMTGDPPEMAEPRRSGGGGGRPRRRRWQPARRRVRRTPETLAAPKMARAPLDAWLMRLRSTAPSPTPTRSARARSTKSTTPTATARLNREFSAMLSELQPGIESAVEQRSATGGRRHHRRQSRGRPLPPPPPRTRGGAAALRHPPERRRSRRRARDLGVAVGLCARRRGARGGARQRGAPGEAHRQLAARRPRAGRLLRRPRARAQEARRPQADEADAADHHRP